jgi:hypothetical protein
MRSTSPRETRADRAQRLAKNKRNKLRRRVKHKPMVCAKCGNVFTSTRADAVTCSNKCRQARHRERQKEAHRQRLIAQRAEHERWEREMWEREKADWLYDHPGKTGDEWKHVISSASSEKERLEYIQWCSERRGRWGKRP